MRDSTFNIALVGLGLAGLVLALVLAGLHKNIKNIILIRLQRLKTL